MSTAARNARKPSKTAGRGHARRRNPSVPWVAAAVLVVLFGVAIAMTRSSELDDNAPPAGVEQHRPVAVDGDALPAFPNEDQDPAVGMQIPAIEGQTFAGETVRISPDGRPKVVVFLAHWCPHCQADVRSVQSWIDAGGAHQGVDLYAVSTWADPAKPNFSPSEWLEREGWTMTTVADDRAGTIASVYGLSGTPMYVFVDDSGTVQWRYAGELPVERLEGAIDDLR